MVSNFSKENMSVIFPEENEYRIKEDPLAWLKNISALHGFKGKKKYLWHPAAFLKALVLFCRTVYAYQNLHEPKKLTELVATYPFRFMAVCKMFYSYFDRKRIDNFYKVINEEFWDIHIAGPKIYAQLEQRCFYVSLAVRGHITASFMCLGLLIFCPLVDMPEGVRHLPNIIWTPFDTNPSPLHEFFYIFLTWNLFLSLFGNVFYDFLFVYYIQHLIAQLTLLRELLTNITSGIMEGSSDVEKFNSKYFQSTVMNRLKICVKHHCRLLKFSKNLQQFSSKILAPQLMMSYVAFVVNGYNLSVDHSEFARTVILFNITGASLIQLAFYAIQASDLEVQSLSVIGAVIESEWNLFQSPIKKGLVLLMLNAEKAMVIRAGGVTNVDKPVLISIIQKSFSAITLLKAIIEDTDSTN